MIRSKKKKKRNSMTFPRVREMYFSIAMFSDDGKLNSKEVDNLVFQLNDEDKVSLNTTV